MLLKKQLFVIRKLILWAQKHYEFNLLDIPKDKSIWDHSLYHP